MSETPSQKSLLKESLQRPGPLVALVAVTLVFAWAYSSAATHLFHRWNVEPEYSHGFFVPAFSLVLLWLRWDMVELSRMKGTIWAWALGLLLLLFGAAMRVASSYYYYDLLDPLSLLPTVAGIVLFLGGWHAFHWAWPAVVYLIFMIPLPGIFAGALSGNLQVIATNAAVYVLQMIGMPASAKGNVILMPTGPLEVAQACSGLRMLIVFFATSTAVAFLAERKLWEKVIVLLSAVPIAIISNVIRIVATGMAQEWFGKDYALDKFHDQAGFVMMPLALVFLWLELTLLDLLVAERPSGDASPPAATADPAVS